MCKNGVNRTQAGLCMEQSELTIGLASRSVSQLLEMSRQTGDEDVALVLTRAFAHLEQAAEEMGEARSRWDGEPSESVEVSLV